MAMTEQEIFNAAYLGLKAQGFKQSVNALGECKYRGDNGLKCAIGHCLTDEELQGSEKNFVLLPELAKSKLGVDLFDHRRYDFLCDLQDAHDRAVVYSMRSNLEAFARDYNLTIPE